ncbi:MAG: hypothetical protein M3Y59_05990 [Myxococcota bacterium]|nr:hypothetical protein [Myxococcota bacterium]
MRTSRTLVLILAVGVLVGCPRPGDATLPDPLESPLEVAGARPRAQALAAYQALLIQDRVGEASQRFDAALTQDSGEPYALMGRLLLEQRAGRPDRTLAAALQLVEKSPKHPLASVAARVVLDLTGAAGPLDDRILQVAQKALAAGLPGDAAHLLRSAVSNIQAQRGDLDGLARTLADMGTPDAFTLVGPLSAHSVLEFQQLAPQEATGVFAEGAPGPLGPLALRALRFRDGRMSLEGEGPYGDVYALGVDVEVPKEGVFTLRTVSAAAHRVHLDGTLVIERHELQRPMSTVAAAGVKLGAGKHRLVVKLAREHTQASLTLSLMRADGRPAGLKFTAALGAPPQWKGVQCTVPSDTYPSADSLARVLEPEVGGTVARFLAARDGMGRDRDGAKRLLARLSPKATGAAVSHLRAEVVEDDRSIPSKVARGRATRFLEEVLAKDPKHVRALLMRADMALEEQRPLDAAEYVKQARAASAPVGFSVPLMEARVQLALNVDAQADASAQAALELQPGQCDALALRYDLARRRDAAQEADALIAALGQCPGNLARSAEHLRVRGDADGAVKLLAQLVERDPSQLRNSYSLASALASQKQYADAVRLLSGLSRLWPHNPALLARTAELEELAGNRDRALKLREQALALDGSNLTLRRMVERAQTGKELLAEHAIDGREALAAYEGDRGQEESAISMVLDASAVRVFPDGSMVERTHVIQKALEQGGIQEIAEVNVPAGAQVLALRTIKADGRVLEPETIENKDTISLPGVQVGDSVQFEYLQARPPRGPGQPGFSAGSFYFRVSKVPNHWSTYKVMAPRGTGMKVDAHNMKAPAVSVVGEEEVFFHEERRVPPFIPEPDAPPSGNEYLPFVQLGAGTLGNDSLVAAYADNQLDNARVTFEVEDFAWQAVGGKKGLEAVRAIHAAVMEKLVGRDAGLGVSAAASLAQDRGSRLWTLKAALEAVGIPTRLVAVRTFSVDPAQYLFPNDSLLPYVCLRVDVPGGEPVWLDPLVRFGPFGELPESARGRPGLLLPEPGRPGGAVQTPKGKPEEGKRVTLEVALSEDGALQGQAEEVYTGFDAARIAEALEAMSPQQRDQALQGALSRYFGGAQLSKLELVLKREVGAPLVVRYQFRAPNFARVDGQRLLMGPLTFPSQLGRRYVQVGSRKTPLFVNDSEVGQTRVKLTLPAGMKVRDALPKPYQLAVPFGDYRRVERQEGNVFLVEEDFRLQMARIPPDQYPAFAAFAGDLDLAQARDLTVSR